MKDGDTQTLTARTGREHQRYSPETGGRLVAGCIPYRRCTNNEDPEILMITSVQENSKKLKWVLPKGGWETDETKEQAAVRETLEEAGVEGKLESGLDEIKFDGKHNAKQIAYMFVLRVEVEHESWAERPRRERQWYPLSEAVDKCSKQWMRDALMKAFPTTSSEDSVQAEGSPSAES